MIFVFFAIITALTQCYDKNNISHNRNWYYIKLKENVVNAKIKTKHSSASKVSKIKNCGKQKFAEVMKENHKIQRQSF